MKLKKFEKKLILNKKTIADLCNKEMKKVNAGINDPKSFAVTGCCPTSGLCTGVVCRIC